MPREMVCFSLYSVQKWSEVKVTSFHNWRIIPGGMNCVLHKPITCNVRFDVFKSKDAGVHSGMLMISAITLIRIR